MKNDLILMDLYFNVLIILVITDNETEALHHVEEAFEDHVKNIVELCLDFATMEKLCTKEDINFTTTTLGQSLGNCLLMPFFLSNNGRKCTISTRCFFLETCT